MEARPSPLSSRAQPRDLQFKLSVAMNLSSRPERSEAEEPAVRSTRTQLDRKARLFVGSAGPICPFERMIVFGAALPAIRERVEHDLSLPGMPRPKILAAIVRLMETTLIRVGNSEYARQNHSYGLTTMRNKHVNDYLREMTNQDFTAKDFRTWAGTVLACAMLRECEAFESETQAKRNVVQVIKGVALRLGNTPSVCRKCYVHPDVLDCYMSGAIIKTMKQQVETESDDQSLRQEEVALLKLLQRRLALAAA